MNYLLAFLLITFPNIFWQILSIVLETNRSFINIDYFVVLLLFMMKRNFLAILFLIVFSFFDFLNLFSQIFPFIRINDLFYLIQFSLLSAPINFLIPIIFFIFVFFYFKIMNKCKAQISVFNIVVFLNIFIFIMLFQNFFLGDNGSRLWQVTSEKIVDSQLLNTYELRSDGFLENFKSSGDVFQNVKVPSASNDLFLNTEEHQKILLIVNESWGVASKEINNELIKDIKSNPKIKNYSISSMDFNGFTINGEIRELCQTNLSHFNLKDQKSGFGHCLPNIYKNKGYITYAMHAATGAMYDRKYWYPKAGFQNLIFRDTLPDLKSRCYSFPGFCDRDLLPYVTNAFRKDKVFFYWLTLNTHMNYDLRDLEKDSFDCGKYGLSVDSSVCRSLKLQKQFFYYLNILINRPDMKSAYIIVVGDHAPPVYGEDKNIFEENKISILKVKVK